MKKSWFFCPKFEKMYSKKWQNFDHVCLKFEHFFQKSLNNHQKMFKKWQFVFALLTTKIIAPFG